MKRGALHGTRLGLPASTLESRIRVLKINKNRVPVSETDDEDRGILRRDISLRDDCDLFRPWSGDIGQGHL